jgi:transposase InsO family protein
LKSDERQGYFILKSCLSVGIPQYLYTDGGKDFKSQHIEQVATELGIVCCLRRKPSDGGIVERPFGTFNWLESMGGITRRTSLFNLGVQDFPAPSF